MKVASFLIVFFISLTFVKADWVLVEKRGRAGTNIITSTNVMTFKFKGHKLRSDNIDGLFRTRVSVIQDFDSGEMTIISHVEKSYHKSHPWQFFDKEASKHESLARNHCTDTGRSELFGHYSAEIYTCTNSLRPSATVWVVRNYPGYPSFQTQLSEMQKAPYYYSGLTLFNTGFDNLPGMWVRTEYVFVSGRCTDELVSLKETPVNDVEFEIPPDYHNSDSDSLTTPHQTGLQINF